MRITFELTDEMIDSYAAQHGEDLTGDAAKTFFKDNIMLEMKRIVVDQRGIKAFETKMKNTQEQAESARAIAIEKAEVEFGLRTEGG